MNARKETYAAIKSTIPSKKERVLKFIEQNPFCTLDEIVEGLPDMKLQTIAGRMAELEREGKIERHGRKKNGVATQTKWRYQSSPMGQEVNRRTYRRRRFREIVFSLNRDYTDFLDGTAVIMGKIVEVN